METRPPLPRKSTRKNSRRVAIGAGQMGSYAKWGRTDNPILAGFYFFSSVGVCLVFMKTHNFKGFRADFNWTLTEF